MYRVIYRKQDGVVIDYEKEEKIVSQFIPDICGTISVEEIPAYNPLEGQYLVVENENLIIKENNL